MKKASFLLIFTAVLLLSCSLERQRAPKYTDKEPLAKIEDPGGLVDKAKNAADNFHNLMNEGRYDEIFHSIDETSELRKDRIYFDHAMNKIVRELGTLQRAELQRTAVFKKKATYEVRLEYIAKFSKEDRKEPRYELIYWEIYPDGKVTLLNYRNGIDNEEGYAY